MIMKPAINAFRIQLICEIWKRSVNNDFRAKNSPVRRRLIEILIPCPSLWSLVDNRLLNSVIIDSHPPSCPISIIQYYNKQHGKETTIDRTIHIRPPNSVIYFSRFTAQKRLFDRNKWQFILSSRTNTWVFNDKPSIYRLGVYLPSILSCSFCIQSKDKYHHRKIK